MVDSIGNIGGIQGVNSPNNTRNTQASGEARNNETIQSDTSISSETLNPAQAEQAATNISAQLTQNQNLTLGLADGFDERI